MSNELLALFLLGLLGLFWSDNRKAYERAKQTCLGICLQHQVELLDDTISIQRLRLVRTYQGIRLQRVYRFDYTDFSTLRKTGYLMMSGRSIDYVRLQEDDHQVI